MWKYKYRLPSFFTLLLGGQPLPSKLILAAGDIWASSCFSFCSATMKMHTQRRKTALVSTLWWERVRKTYNFVVKMRASAFNWTTTTTPLFFKRSKQSGHPCYLVLENLSGCEELRKDNCSRNPCPRKYWPLFYLRVFYNPHKAGCRPRSVFRTLSVTSKMFSYSCSVRGQLKVPELKSRLSRHPWSAIHGVSALIKQSDLHIIARTVRTVDHSGRPQSL